MTKPKATADLDPGAPDDATVDEDTPSDVSEADVQGSVPTPNGVEGEVVSIPVGGDGPPIDTPKSAYDDPGPTPITPASSQEQYNARVRYEEQVNGQVEAWIEANKPALIERLLAGGSAELRHLDADGNEVTDDADDDADDTVVKPKS